MIECERVYIIVWIESERIKYNKIKEKFEKKCHGIGTKGW